MNFGNKTVLITGINGFLASELAEELLERNAKVIGLVHNSTNCLELHGIREKIQLEKASIRDFKALEKVFQKNKIDYCIHLAAQTSVSKAESNPVKTFETNTMGTINLLETIRRNGNVKGTIIASSGKAYGLHKNKKVLKEEDELLSNTIYGTSKACADMISLNFAKTYRMDVCVTRAGNVFGPMDLDFSRIIPSTIRRIFENQKPIVRGKGKSKRDFVFVKDASDFYLRLLENISEKNVSGKAFNIATGKQSTILGVVEKILKKMNKKIEIEFIEQDFAEEEENVLSIAKAKKLLGWRQKYSFEKGLDETVEWYKSFLVRQKKP